MPGSGVIRNNCRVTPASFSNLARKPVSGFSLAAATYIFAAVMTGTTLPTPLYPEYERVFGFGSFGVTTLFAVYAAGVIVALVLFGRLSDALGRRPVLLIALGFAMASSLLFLVADHTWMLYVGRVLSGVSAGIFTATGTVTVLENAPKKHRVLAASLATAANMGGLGLGILLAGLFATWFAAPLRTSYAMHAALLVLAGVALLVVRETAPEPRVRWRPQRPVIPAEAGRPFRIAVFGCIAGFTTCGLWSAVAPVFLATRAHVHSAAVTGAAIALLFLTSAAAQIVFRSLSDARLRLIGTLALCAAMVIETAALLGSSVWLFTLASLFAGCGQGLLVMTGLRSSVAATPPHLRTEVTTAFFLVAYFSISVPAVLAGFLAELMGLEGASIVFAALVAALSIAGLVAARRVSR